MLTQKMKLNLSFIHPIFQMCMILSPHRTQKKTFSRKFMLLVHIIKVNRGLGSIKLKKKKTKLKSWIILFACVFCPVFTVWIVCPVFCFMDYNSNLDCLNKSCT